MTSIIGALRISLGLETAAFEKGSKRAAAEVDALGSRMEKAGFAVGRLTKTLIAGGAAIAGSAIIGKIKDMAMEGLELAGSLGEQAEKLGVNVTALQRYRFIADQIGISQETMDRGLSKVSLTLGDLANGAKAPAEALKRMGFTQAEIVRISKMTAEEAIPQIAGKFQMLGSETEKLSVLGQLLGRKFGPELKNLFDQGKGGIDELTKSYAALGVAISPEEAAAADAALDEMSKQRAALAAEEAKFSAQHAQEIQQASHEWELFKLSVFKNTVAATGAIHQFAVDTDAAIRPFGDRLRERLKSAFLGFEEFKARFRALPGEIVQYLSALVGEVRGWIVTRLGKVWAEAQAPIERVKGWFHGLYDAVVGHSYIPDMVEGIAAQMARLDAVMVKPAKTAAERTKAEFEQLQQDVRSIMDELFPEAVAQAEKAKKLATIDKAIASGKTGFTTDQLQLGKTKLLMPHLEDGLSDMADQVWGQIAKVGGAFDTFRDKAKEAGKDIAAANVRIVKSFKDMADETLNAVSRLTGAIKSGGFLGILEAVVGLGLQLGSIGAFGKSIQTRINAPVGTPPIKDAKARGGSVRERAAYVVGERGPEVFVPGMRGGIIPNSAMNDNRQRVEIVDTTGLFRFRVNGQIMAAAPSIMDGGARVSQRRQARAQSRRLA